MTEPQSIFNIVENTPCFVYHQVKYDKLTLQTPWSGVNFKNVMGYEVEDTPEVLLGEDFCKSIGFDFEKHIHAQQETLQDMEMLESSTTPTAPGDTPGTVRRLITMGGHQPTQAEENRYVPQPYEQHNPAIDRDPLEASAPNITIGPVDAEHEDAILHRMIDRAYI